MGRIQSDESMVPEKVDEANGGRRAPARIPPQVVALGWVSLLTDAASDMVYPLLPELLRSIGAGAASLGLVEGVAEAIASASRVGFGWATDRVRHKKPLVLGGYGLATLARPLFALVSAPAQVVAVRSVDRIGKGMRGPPRDALLAAATTVGGRGVAFGFHRMMDNVGSAIGPILAFLLLELAGVSLRSLFVWSLVPGLLSVLVLAMAVRDVTRAPEGSGAHPALTAPRSLPSPARRYLVAFGVFSLAGSADTFLLQRLMDLGLRTAWLPLAWVSLQLAKALMNIPGGRASDRLGHRRLLAAAWIVYAAAYAAFGFARSIPAFWALMMFYAVYYGLAEGAQKAILADFVPSSLRGRAFGTQAALEGLLVLPANLLFGALYAARGPELAFLTGSAFALVAAILMLVLVPREA